MIRTMSVSGLAELTRSARDALATAVVNGWSPAQFEIFVQWMSRAVGPDKTEGKDRWGAILDRLVIEVKEMTGSNMVPERVQKYERELREEGREEGQQQLAEEVISRMIQAGVSDENIRVWFDLKSEEFEEYKNGGGEPNSD